MYNDVSKQIIVKKTIKPLEEIYEMRIKHSKAVFIICLREFPVKLCTNNDVIIHVYRHSYVDCKSLNDESVSNDGSK